MHHTLIQNKNIAKIAKLPYGAKTGSFEEKKGFIEGKAIEN